MKKRSIVNAYKSVHPDEEARNRMLHNILLSSKISPEGKDERIMRKKTKPILIAAIIGLMVLMMGCALIAFSLQDMKIGESSYGSGVILDSDGNVIKNTVFKKEVISLQGLANSPGQLAAKEWFEFSRDYDQDYTLSINAEKQGFQAPDEYDAYDPYTQEMIDKVEEIARKYGLKLAGTEYTVQQWENSILLDALGLEDLHHVQDGLEMEYLGGYFYACGNFNLEFVITLTDDVNQCTYEIPGSMRYNGKEYMDTVAFSIDVKDYEQWNYVTEDGTTVLIVMYGNIARIFCDREDAFVSVFLYTDYILSSDEVKCMKHRDVELVADAIDFHIKPQKVDENTVREQLKASSSQKASEDAEQEAIRPDDTYWGFIQDRLVTLEHPENLMFYLLDVDDNGVVDLLLGNGDSCETVWTIQDGYLTFPNLTDNDWLKIDALWPELEIKPITEFIAIE